MVQDTARVFEIFVLARSLKLGLRDPLPLSRSTFGIELGEAANNALVLHPAETRFEMFVVGR